MKNLLCLFSVLFLVACSKEDVSEDVLIEVEPLQNEIKENVANVIFTMDDGWDTQYTDGYRILDKYSLKGNIGVVTGLVDNENYITKEQLKEMYDRGWDVINHTKSHQDLSTLSKEEQRKEILGAKKWMNDNGYYRGLDKIIYPYGTLNTDTLEILEEEGFVWGRTVEKGENYTVNLQTNGFNLITNLNPDVAKKEIDRAIDTKETIVFISHRFGDEDDGYDMFYDTESFEELVSYVADKKEQGLINVLTVSEFVDLIGTEKDDNGIVWSEDFSSINWNKWSVIEQGDNYNNELQFYKKENVSVENNELRIKALKENYKHHEFTSGRITTKDKFEFMYGRVEFKAKIDFEMGSFPAIWLQSSSGEVFPEVDMFEAIGKEKGYIYYVNHWQDRGKHRSSVAKKKIDNQKEYHSYAIEWKKGEIKWFIDDEHVFTSTVGIPDEPMYLTINLAVGGVWGGKPNESSKFPFELTVKDLKVIRGEG